jgi:hypothetical protein
MAGLQEEQHEHGQGKWDERRDYLGLSLKSYSTSLPVCPSSDSRCARFGTGYPVAKTLSHAQPPSSWQR